jgi:hypothetical protein
MTDPISLSEFRYRRELATSTALPVDARHSDATVSYRSSGDQIVWPAHVGDALSAAVLRKLDPDTELGRFLDVTAEVIQAFNTCSQELSSGRNLAADDKLMAARQLLAELFMLRAISDAVGVIVLAALEATSRVAAIVDAPEMPAACVAALNRLLAAPFMDFAEAANLAHSIEVAAKTEGMTAFNALVDELLDAQADAPLE